MNFRATAKFAPIDLVRVQSSIVPRIVAAVNEGCGAVVEEAQAIVPVDTGELRDSIGTQTVELVGTTVAGTVAATAGYAGFVEFGTGLHGEGTYPGELPQSGVPFTGSWVYDFKRQNWQGHTARPYMRPALDTARPEIIEAYRKQGFRIR